jgi:hypothetical protein
VRPVRCVRGIASGPTTCDERVLRRSVRCGTTRRVVEIGGLDCYLRWWLRPPASSLAVFKDESGEPHFCELEPAGQVAGDVDLLRSTA